LTGYQEVLQRLPRSKTLDLEEAADQLVDPDSHQAIFLFGCRIKEPLMEPTPGPSRYKRKEPERPKGIIVSHSADVQKFGSHRYAKLVRNFLAENWPLAPELNSPAWLDALAELKAAALSENTWKKYLSVFENI
jgi:hypothetical protein